MFIGDFEEENISYSESVEKKIKNRCFMCSLWFKNSFDHYETYGNACKTCTGRIIRVFFNSKQQSRRKLSKEEADYYLSVRREWVARNHLHLPPKERPKRTVNGHPPEEP